MPGFHLHHEHPIEWAAVRLATRVHLIAPWQDPFWTGRRLEYAFMHECGVEKGELCVKIEFICLT